MYTQEEVLDFIQEEDVKFIRLAFFDLQGKQKNISIMADELPIAFKNGVNFDASSIEGFQSPDNSDLFLHPDPSTLVVLPWRPSTGKVVRMFCDIRYSDGTPYEKDCRYLLKFAAQKIKKEYGVELKFGTDIEFYLLKLDENGLPTNTPFDNAGYLDVAPEDKGENIRRDICFTLEQMGIIPLTSHHEAGPGQNEVDFHHADSLSAADNTSTFKWIVSTKAASNGLFADFSPKLFKDKPGSGMHINISAHPADNSDNTEVTKQVLAGIYNHLAEITLFLNPTENSYDRLGECRASRYISWGKGNRSASIRIPTSKELKVEVRSCDPSCNPYLAFTVLIYAAMDGIKNKMVPPESIDYNLFSAAHIETAKLETLPSSLREAYERACASGLVKEAVGQKILNEFKIK